MTYPLLEKSVPLHLLQLESFPILAQLQLEEALLRADTRNWCIINYGSPPAIVMGISGKPEVLLDQKKLTQVPVSVIRRFSGGGTVFVDQQTFFVSWICNAEHSGVGGCPQKLHKWTEKFYQSAWPAINMELRENDYVAGDRKFGGNAQYLCKDRWLHHSSLLWDFKAENMDYLLMPPKVPTYRQQRNHTAFLCRLCELFVSKEQMETQFLQTLQHQFRVIKMSLEDVKAISELPHRRATHEVYTMLH